MHPEDLQRLLTVEMPYGKHKGRLIADLPGNYLNWFAREGFQRYLIRLEINLPSKSSHSYGLCQVKNHRQCLLNIPPEKPIAINAHDLLQKNVGEI